MKRLSFVVLLAFLVAIPMMAQTNVFNCGSSGTAWNTSGSFAACGISTTGTAGSSFGFFGSFAANPVVTGGVPNIQPVGTVHDPISMDYLVAPVGVQAFKTHYKYVANGWNLVFVANNATHNGGASAAPGLTLAQSFNGGAGCEGALYQAFGGYPGNPPPNNIFGLNLDSSNYNTSGGFTYSNAQIYQQLQSPCIPNDSQPWWYPTNKVSTSPVPMNSPAGTITTTTGDTYDVTLIYTGTSVTVNMFDVTASGTCSPVTSGSCFTYTWPNVSIPSLVNGTTAYVNLGGSTNGSTTTALTIPQWDYSTLTAAATPTLSPSAGTYGSTQTVTVSDSSSGSIICYNATGAPATDGNGNCIGSTKYTGTLSVAKGQTIYAVAGSGASLYGDSAIVTAAYDITGSASSPTFNQAGGTWQGSQTVYLTAAHGGVICYNTTGSPATNGSTGCTTGTLYSSASPILVSSNETLYAVAGGTGFADSAIGSAAYVINPFGGSFLPANSPTFSVAPGTYSGTQSVTLASSTASSNICYETASSPPSLLPEPNSLGGCSVGTSYSSAISVAATTTIYAAAGTTIAGGVSGTGPPSSVSSAPFVITGSNPQASTPTFSPGANTYVGTQSVALSTSSSGAVICYTTNGTTPATNGSSGCTTGTLYSGAITIASGETVKAVAGGTSYSDSNPGSAAYTINQPVGSALGAGTALTSGTKFQ